jgi:hypothetical protein
MSRFKWGHSFFTTNAEILERYAACDTAADVIAAQVCCWVAGTGGGLISCLLGHACFHRAG